MSVTHFKNNVRAKSEQAVVEHLRSCNLSWVKKDHIRAGMDLVTKETPVIRVRCDQATYMETLDGSWRCTVRIVLLSDATENQDQEEHIRREGELVGWLMTEDLATDLNSATVEFYADFAKVVSQQLEQADKHYKSVITLEIDCAGVYRT